MAWLILIVAGLTEVGWAVGLKYTDGFTRLWPTVLTVLGLAASMVFLALAVRTIPIGTGLSSSAARAASASPLACARWPLTSSSAAYQAGKRITTVARYSAACSHWAARSTSPARAAAIAAPAAARSAPFERRSSTGACDWPSPTVWDRAAKPTSSSCTCTAVHCGCAA